MMGKSEMGTEPRIIVKLRDDLVLPYQDNAETVLPADLSATWLTLAATFPDAGLALNRLMPTVDEEQLDQLLDAVRAASGNTPPALRSLMAVDVSGPVDRAPLVAALQSLPFIEYAYEESPMVQPSVDPSDDTFAPLQGYLNVAPFGVEAFQAWAFPGSDGAGVRFLDIERGRNLTREDLAGAGVVPLNASVPGNEVHSTHSLGVVLAQGNNRGVIGLAPKVTAAIASSMRPTLADAFVLAVGFLNAGDVLLIEEQTIEGEPVETDPHLALLIRALPLLGITVIEPAGNGSSALDNLLRPDGTALDRFSTMFFDSGAVVVGARYPLESRGRLPASSFGNRTDRHAWGEQIVTTSPAMRDMLGGPFNTMSDNPALDQIGFMPKLNEVIARP
jgi:hypothetical protein